MELKLLPAEYAVCRLEKWEDAVFPKDAFFSLTRTEEEISLVLQASAIPAGACAEKGWRILGVLGKLDFALVGILAELTRILSEAGVSVFAVSTYDTDYLLVREIALADAIFALENAGHRIQYAEGEQY